MRKTINNIIRSAAAVMLTAFVASSAAAVCAGENDELALLMHRPATGVWYSMSDACSFQAVRLGGEGDVIVPADYDGDGAVDMAVYNARLGRWSVRSSNTGAIDNYTPITARAKQQMSNTPVPSDYDGDGRADIAVWHSGSGEWSIFASGSGYSKNSVRTERLGGAGDIPVPADYDGDGRADIAVFEPATGRWSVIESRSGKLTGVIIADLSAGKLMPADYTGDGKADIAFFSGGKWVIRDSGTGETEAYELGINDAEPVPADYDRDGTIDIALYSAGKWIIQLSSGDGLTGMEFGAEGDLPVAAVPVRNLN